MGTIGQFEDDGTVNRNCVLAAGRFLKRRVFDDPGRAYYHG